MKQILFYWLQAGVDPNDVKKFSDYAGPIGVMLSITLGVVSLLSVLLYRTLTHQVKEKNTHISKLEAHVSRLENKIDDMQNGIFREVLKAMERNSDAIDNNNIAINDNSSMLGRAEATINSSNQGVIDVFEKVIDKLKL